MSLIPDPARGGPKPANDKRKRFMIVALVCLFALLIGFGVFAQNGWLPHTDPMTGKKTGWFGKELPKNAANSWNPFAAPLPTATPQLSKEYIHAGSRTLAVEDVNADATWPADLAIWRPSNGNWVLYDSTVRFGEGTATQWGMSGDIPVQGDYDGDGKTDFSIFRPSTNGWWIMKSSDGTYNALTYGSTGDIVASADYDGDGKTDVALFRPSNGNWYVIQSSTGNAVVAGQVGTSGDVPAPVDYDGDGKADICVWRYGSPSQFIYRRSSDNQTQTVNLGSASTDKPVSGDYDGDGKADFALFNGNAWTILQSSTNTTTTVTWQATGGTPVQNDYDGDGKVDIAVWLLELQKGTYRGKWYIRNSHDLSTRTDILGITGDIPVPAFYKR